jgi:phage head maturation protease
MDTRKYIDTALKLLDPRYREFEPAIGDRSASCMAVRAIDTKARTVEAVASTSQVDRYEEIVEPSAYAKWLPHFMANPVLMPGHQYTLADGKPAQIGTWLDVRITSEGLVGTAWFDEDETADAWWRKYSHPDPRKRAKGFSVGFLSHAWEMREFDQPHGRKRLRVFTEVELLEISAVPIPANRGALAREASAVGGDSIEAADADGEDNGGGKLSNRQLAIALRMLRPVIRREVGLAVSRELLGTLVEETVEACMRAWGGCHRGGGHHHQGDLSYVDPDSLDELESPDADDPADTAEATETAAALHDTLRNLLAPPAGR